MMNAYTPLSCYLVWDFAFDFLDLFLLVNITS